ncbi:MAG: hypothetical protein AUH43_02840 [Acidobacteria bacterium 13_1_40CM_65_14]|nr:MAG: hypothetical protein AUH43_02840 [Acidobacteria bacterium 13_1_40CM_65_14]
MREAYAELPGVRLWDRDSEGRGSPVVFLHAATGSRRVWEHQEDVFIAAGLRFIAYDRRGFGRTSVDPPGTPPGTGADDLHGLMDHLRTDRFHMVGTGAGAFICIDYALSFPFWRFCCSRRARTRPRGSSRRIVTRLSRTTTAPACGRLETTSWRRASAWAPMIC